MPQNPGPWQEGVCVIRPERHPPPRGPYPWSQDGRDAERARKAVQSKQGGGGEGRGANFAHERRWDLFGDPRVYCVPTARLSSSHPLSMP
jgi:hypothetical protein